MKLPSVNSNSIYFQMKVIYILFLFLLLHLISFPQNFLISLTNFNISSIPSHQDSVFPESALNNNLAIGYNRAKICWYMIDPVFF